MPTVQKVTINKNSIAFLKTIGKNNNREWFSANKDLYLAAHSNIVAFADGLLFELNRHDKIETPTGKSSLYRIYKDVRFSKDKTPYNQHWSGGFKRATKLLRGGYYFHIKPGNNFVAGGFWGPNPDDMKRIREDIDYNYNDWKKLLANKTLVNTFGKMSGEQLANAPRGYAKDHPAIDLLRYKQFIFRKNFTDKEVLEQDFILNVNKTFKSLRPFFNYMSEVLTTDTNGILIV